MRIEILNNGIRFYKNNNDGHGLDHIKEVMSNMTKLIEIVEREENIKLNKELMMTAVLYHDAGNMIDRKNHHIESAKIVRSEEYLKEIFTEEEIELIATMCEEHRSSRKEECTSLMSAMLNDADSINTFENMVERAYKYHMKHDEDKGYEYIFERVYGHLKEKFGRNGYHKYRTKYTNELINIEERYRMLENEDEFRKVFDKIAEKR